MGLLYSELAAAMEQLESTTKRLQMQDYLVRLYLKVGPQDAANVTYLLLGTLGPKYDSPELGVADKLVLKALSIRKGISEKELNDELSKTGDIGDLVKTNLEKKQQQTLMSFGDDDEEQVAELTVAQVHADFIKMAGKKDKSSQSLKLDILNGLFQKATPLEAKYITRFITQRMRLGVKDLTLLEALAFVTPYQWDDHAPALAEDIRSLGALVPEVDINPTVKSVLGREASSLNASEEIAKNLHIALKRAGSPPPEAAEIRASIEQRSSEMRAMVKRMRGRIERAYNAYPDIGHIAHLLIIRGPDMLDDVDVTPFVPLKPMLAERLPSLDEIIEKLGRCALEYKYDGLRMQVHVNNGQVRMFSRGMEEQTGQFPDVVAAVKEQFKGSSIIADAECIPIHPETGEILPFQVISRRRGRKFGLQTEDTTVTLDETQKHTFEDDYPVALALFDCLFLGDVGGSMLDEPYLDRRAKLSEAFELDDRITLSTQIVTDDIKEAEKFFDTAISSGCEGIVAKSVGEDSTYQAGARGYNWIKYKRDYRQDLADSLDLVVMGAFWGHGRRGGVFGAYLMGSFDPETESFQTVCKLGTGFTDEMLARFTQELGEHVIEDKPDNYQVAKALEPDVWFDPVAVWEVVGAEVSFSPVHMCGFSALKPDVGLALRFPRLSRIRDDKDAYSATTTNEVIGLYGSQGKNALWQ